MAKPFLHMLFSDQAHRDITTVSVTKGHPEQGFQHEDAFGMVAELCMLQLPKASPARLAQSDPVDAGPTVTLSCMSIDNTITK